MNGNTYKILLDGKWSLTDLNEFSRIYLQNYSFLYCLEKNAVPVAASHFDKVLDSYELRHGLSYVNIYDVFKSSISKEHLPQIESIQYASPGWMELALDTDVALQLAKVIGIYGGSIVAVGEAYKKLNSIFLELSKKRRKLNSENLKLAAADVKEAQKLSIELAKGLGFESLKELDDSVKDIEESSKLLMAHYRRIDKVAQFVKQRKAKFPLK